LYQQRLAQTICGI